MIFALLGVAVFSAAGSAETAVAAEPKRVVSINLCADQLVLQLLDRERIASVSFLGADPLYSAVAEQARGIPLNHGLAEEILRLDPDVVVAGTYTSRATVGLLRRLGFQVVEIGLPRDIATVRRQILDLAKALGVRQRGRSLVASFDRRIEAAAPGDAARRPAAVIYEANGITIGGGELADAALQVAGFRNLAAEMGARGMASLPLERLVLAEPDLLVLQTEDDAPPSIAQAILRHPALEGIVDRHAMVTIPRVLWTCGGPQLAEAIVRLAKARRELARSTQSMEGSQ
jgi:iron complex transport system substrate-binding protein